MADASYDAIVAGGGHQGTIIACYLQKAGMKTAIFERLNKLGGPVSSDKDLIPGFIINPGANWSRFYSHPAYEDFSLNEKGLKYIFPEHNEGMIFDNETCIVGYSASQVVDPATGRSEFSDKNVQKTLKEIARFSKRDADTAEELLRRYKTKWQAAFRKYSFLLPTPWGEKNELEKLCDDPKDGIDPVYQFMTNQQLAYDLFESDEMRTFFMRAVMTSSGCSPDDVTGLYGFVHTLSLVLSWQPVAIAVGGTQSVTNSLQRAFTEMGGKFFVGTEVEKLLIQNDTAKGIRLSDGTEVEAKKLVVSDLSTFQTVCQLIDEDNVNPKIIQRVKNIRIARGKVWGGTIAVHELPKYKANTFNPDCGLQPRLYIGPKDPDYLAANHRAEILINGVASRLLLFVGTDTMWDKTRSPEGKHLIVIEEFTAPLRLFSASRWQQFREDLLPLVLREWQLYAPNMTRDNVIDTYLVTPQIIANWNINMREGSFSCGDMITSQQDRFRPIPELSHYRMPIKNFYLCSSSAHSGPGIGRGSGYCCYKVIAEDFGLEKIWEKKGRSY